MTWTEALTRRYGQPDDNTAAANNGRAQRARTALDQYADATGADDSEDATTIAVDLIANVLHLCTQQHEDPKHVLTQAWDHFTAEAGAGYNNTTQ